MKIADITQKLSRLQLGLERHRERPDLTATLEELYWREVDRLRLLKCYDELPRYVSWLALYYRSPPSPD